MRTTLRRYHGKVEAVAEEAERLIRSEGPAALPRIARLRVDQGVAMAAYQLFVHREVFEPLTQAGSATQREAAKQLKVECVLFSGAFCRYLQEWSRRDPADEWTAYRRAALEMIAAIRTHVARVESELSPALEDQAEAVGLPRRAAAHP